MGKTSDTQKALEFFYNWIKADSFLDEIKGKIIDAKTIGIYLKLD